MLLFWPALSKNWSWKTICCLFESGCYKQVLMYNNTYLTWHLTSLFHLKIETKLINSKKNMTCSFWSKITRHPSYLVGFAITLIYVVLSELFRQSGPYIRPIFLFFDQNICSGNSKETVLLSTKTHLLYPHLLFKEIIWYIAMTANHQLCNCYKMLADNQTKLSKSIWTCVILFNVNRLFNCKDKKQKPCHTQRQLPRVP